MMLTIRRGAPSRRMIAVAAIGSVGARIPPSANAAAQGRSSANRATTATSTAVSSTSPIDSSEIARRSARSARRSAKNAATYSSGGRKITSTRSGSSSGSGRPGTRAQRQAADHEQDRIGNADLPREHAERRKCDQQDEEQLLGVVHSAYLSGNLCAATVAATSTLGEWTDPCPRP